MSKQQMTGADAAWFHMDRPTNLMVVNGMLWFDEPFDMERAREVIHERLVERFPRFRQRVVEPRLGVGVPHWEDDPNFDFDRHVHNLALPKPGDRAALQDLVADLMPVPLDRSKPLWDMYIVDGYGSGMALIARMHHCIADGVALARVLLSLTDQEADAGIQERMSEVGGQGPLAALSRPARAGARLAQAALHEGFEALLHPQAELSSITARAGDDARALGKLLLTLPDSKTVLKGDLGVAQRVTWSERIPLDDVKRIGHSTGTTVNDVLVTAMTGALHRYLAERGDSVDEIRAMVPFNLRPLDQPLPRDLGNRFGLVYLSLPVGIAGPRKRLDEVHRRMQAIKSSPEGPVSYGILGLVGLTPRQVERRLVDVFTSKTTVLVTNVPGPREPVYFAGSRVAGALGWVPSSGGIGIGLSIFSYDGGITVGLRTDAGLMPDPEAIIEALDPELKALKRLGSRRSGSRRSSSPAAAG